MYPCSGGEGAFHHLLMGRWLPPYCVFPVSVSPDTGQDHFLPLPLAGCSEIISFSCLGDESSRAEKIVEKSGSVLSQVHPYFCLQSI